MEQDRMREAIESWLMRPTAISSATTVFGAGCALGTDIGINRKENQDRIIAASIEFDGFPCQVYVLADGMGGMSDGASCASIAISTFLSTIVSSKKRILELVILDAIHASNAKVHERYKGKGGTTLSALVCDRWEAIAVNIGDSRIYLHSKDSLRQISTDDTLAGQMNRSAKYAPADGALLQFIGVGSDLSPHLFHLSNYSGPVVLTSDGAHYLSHEILSSLFKYSPSKLTFVKRALAISKWCGGHDNASVAVVDLPQHSNRRSKSAYIVIQDPYGEIAVANNIFHIEEVDKKLSTEAGVIEGPSLAEDAKGNLALRDGSEDRKNTEKLASKASINKKLKRKSKIKAIPEIHEKPDLHVELFNDEGDKE